MIKKATRAKVVVFTSALDVAQTVRTGTPVQNDLLELGPASLAFPWSLHGRFPNSVQELV
jgi:hypothetical protein